MTADNRGAEPEMPVQTGAAGAAGKQGISGPTVLISKCSVINTKEGIYVMATAFVYVYVNEIVCIFVVETWE